VIYRENVYVAPKRGPRISLAESHARFRKGTTLGMAFAVLNGVAAALPMGWGNFRLVSVFCSGVVAFLLWAQHKTRKRLDRLWERKRLNRVNRITRQFEELTPRERLMLLQGMRERLEASPDAPRYDRARHLGAMFPWMEKKR
jgi:hypothetical protein